MKFETTWQKPRSFVTRKSGRMLREAAHSLMGRAAREAAENALLEFIGDARLVLLGEASHGTLEFYELRARLTRRLIEEKGFRVLAVEADWPDMQRVDRYVRGLEGDATAAEALGGFTRFPRWMWRNPVIVQLVEWMRAFNGRPENADSPADMYGLDLYSLHSSMEAVIRFLEKSDPPAARRAKARYACFDAFGSDPRLYGFSAKDGLDSCEAAVVEQLVELREMAETIVDHPTREEAFFAEQNALLVRNAEEYYRTLFKGNAASWNLRDGHMAETVEAVVHFRARKEREVGTVVWAHNSHLGDARATEMADRGELNVGQLLRERYREKCVNIGFTTYGGTVTAARDWDQPPERRRIRPALEGSYEALLHVVGGNFWLDLRTQDAVKELLGEPRLERAIGVIYRPESERLSHYFYSILPEQFDALVHLDQTHALDPLERTAQWECGELPETYPWAL